MSAHALPSFHVHATVTVIDLNDSLNVLLWIQPEGGANDVEPTAVTFERSGEHLDPAMLETAAGLKQGDAVDVQYTQISDGLKTINMGRSVIKTG